MSRQYRRGMAGHRPILKSAVHAASREGIWTELAQEGFEPSASLVLSESGLPVAYRAINADHQLRMSTAYLPRSERGVTTSSNYPGVGDSGRRIRTSTS